MSCMYECECVYVRMCICISSVMTSHDNIIIIKNHDTCGVPSSAASRINCWRIRMVSLVYFSSWKSSFSGMTSDLDGGWGEVLLGTSCFSPSRDLNSDTKSSMTVSTARSYNTLPSSDPGSISPIDNELLVLWQAVSAQEISSGICLIFTASLEVTFSIFEWRSGSGNTIITMTATWSKCTYRWINVHRLHVIHTTSLN